MIFPLFLIRFLGYRKPIPDDLFIKPTRKWARSIGEAALQQDRSWVFNTFLPHHLEAISHGVSEHWHYHHLFGDIQIQNALQQIGP